MRNRSYSAIAILLAAGCEARELGFPLPEPEILRPPQLEPISVPKPGGGDLFDPERILDVDIFVASEDWERIRTDSFAPDLFERPDCQAEPYPEFAFYPGTVVIDRAIVEDARVRQRGFRFEQNEYLPSLEVRLPRPYAGRSRLILRNALGDPTVLRACLAYSLFDKAGGAAPRCSFAHVRVNGWDLGVYAHVEPVDEDLVADRFGVAGPIFEGTYSDFRSGWMATFAGSGDRSAILALQEALTATDDRLIEEVAAVVDLEAFHRFWAVETLIGHFDGYAGNAGRFFIFQHPERGLLFLPSGTELAFRPYNPYRPAEPQPASVYADGELARRLYLTPAGRARHLRALARALEEVWDEDALLAEIDRMEALIQDRFLDWRSDRAEETEALREFVRTRRAAIEAELPQGAPWAAQRRPSICVVPRGTIDAALTTTWDTLPLPGAPFEQIFETGSSTLAARFDEVAYVQTGAGGGAAGMQEGFALLVAVVPTYPAGSGLVLFVAMDPSLLVPGTVPIMPELGPAYGQAAWYQNGLPVWVGYLNGELSIRAAEATAGAAIDVSLSGDLY